MKKKHRLVVRYSVLFGLMLGLCAWGAVALLNATAGEEDVEGLAPGVVDFVARSIPASAPAVRFTLIPIDFRHFPGERTRRLSEDMGSGVAIEDFDGDGRLDLFLVNNGPHGQAPPPCALFRNLGDMRFERVESGMPALYGMGVAVADYDADGDFDIYVTGYGRNVLLRNDGGFVFTDVTREAGVGGGGFSAGACWGDVDGDGDLDLYVCRYVVFDENTQPSASRRGRTSLPASLNPSAFPAEKNLLYLNEGGRFREASAELSVDNPGGKSLGALFADFDEDGVLDLYVANDVTDNALFRGQRGAPFQDASHGSSTADWRGAMGLAVGDPDGDGDLDLFVTHWKPEENALYIREKGLLFRDDSVRTCLGPPGRGLVGWACEFLDLDLDGQTDLYVLNGDTFEDPESPSHLMPMAAQVFWNDGQRFWELARRSGEALRNPLVGRGGMSGDLDGDGDLDLVLVVHGGAPLVLRNDTPTENHHLEVAVRSSAPNVFGYGATVTVEVGGKRQAQVVGAKISYLSSGPHTLTFGLGKHGAADAVHVRYLSGKTVVKRHVRAGTRLVVKEVDARALGKRMDRARDALAAQHPGEARAVLREVVRLDPTHAAAHYQLAQLESPAVARRLCDRLTLLEPRVPRGFLLRARIHSDPALPGVFDLDRAQEDIARAQRLNRHETGAVLALGRVLVLKGDIERARKVLAEVRHNPRAAALEALCLFRLGRGDEALALLNRPRPGAPRGIAEEGDTAKRKMGDRDLLARLLSLPPAPGWTVHREAPKGESKRTAISATDPVSITPVSFQVAARWCLSPPAHCTSPPPGMTVVCERDLDNDGDRDLIVRAVPADPTAPLPWWILFKDSDGYRPLRGVLPTRGRGIVAIHVADSNDGQVEFRLTEGSELPGHEGATWTATLTDKK